MDIHFGQKKKKIKKIGGYMKKNECKQTEKYEEKWESSQRYYLKDTVEPP